MKTIIIDLPDGYDDVLSVTAIGRSENNMMNIRTSAFNLKQGNHLEILINGSNKQYFDEETNNETDNNSECD